MPDIKIKVADKIATNLEPSKLIVCGNSDYTVTFEFDEEWDAEPERTARFVYYKDGLPGNFEEKEFTGNTAPVPILADIDSVLVGVYAGNLHTTAPARVWCDKSILCGNPVEILTPAEKASLQHQIGSLSKLQTENKSNLVEAVNEVRSEIKETTKGAAGGHYTPTVSQPETGKMRVEYTPSQEDMPAVAPVDVELPKGNTGDTGEQGPAGAAGTTPHIGENGNWWIGDTDTGKPSRGEQGEKGDPGADGQDGADGYTPVKGTDYWTEADKAEMAQDVLEQVPEAEYTLPVATEETLGGVKPVAATEEMTQDVGVTEEGKLVTVPGQVTDEQVAGAVETYLEANPVSGGIPVPETAEVGQTIVVKAVDDNGKPTEWEVADLPSGDEWETIFPYAKLEDISGTTSLTQDLGASYKTVVIYLSQDAGYSMTMKEDGTYVNDSPVTVTAEGDHKVNIKAPQGYCGVFIIFDNYGPNQRVTVRNRPYAYLGTGSLIDAATDTTAHRMNKGNHNMSKLTIKTVVSGIVFNYTYMVIWGVKA